MPSKINQRGPGKTSIKKANQDQHSLAGERLCQHLLQEAECVCGYAGMLINPENTSVVKPPWKLQHVIMTPIILIMHQILSFGTWSLKVLNVLEVLWKYFIPAVFDCHHFNSPLWMLNGLEYLCTIWYWVT